MQIFLKVQFPAALPFVFTGAKVAITLAVIGAVIGVPAAWAVSRMPPEELESMDELPVVPRVTLSLPGVWKGLAVLGLFGGIGDLRRLRSADVTVPEVSRMRIFIARNRSINPAAASTSPTLAP